MYANRIVIHKMKHKSANPIIITAMKNLNPHGMKIFQKIMRDSSGYVYDEYVDVTCYIYHVQYPAKKRYFSNKISRFSCNDVVANRQQCKHEFLLRKMFIKDNCSFLWNSREGLTKSMDIGS